MFVIAAVAFLPAVVIIVENVLTLRQTRTTEMHAQAWKAAELASLEIERILDGTESVLRVVIAAPVVARRDAPACVEFIERVIDSLPYLASITLIDSDGSVWCMPDRGPGSLNVADRPYFQDAMATDKRVTGVFTVGRRTGRLVLPVALRYETAEGEIVGVVAGYINLNWLQTTLDQRSFTPGSSLTIADRDGRILARRPEPERFVGTVIPDAFQRLVQASVPGTEDLTSQDGTRRIIGYFPAGNSPTGIYVSAGLAVDTVLAPIWRLALVGASISILGMLAALVIATYTSRVYIVRPFERLIHTIDAWRRGETQVRSRMSDDQGEIARVGIALDTFMDELLESRAARRRAEEQREMLAQELNHRVKNLLTLIQVVARQSFAETDAKDAVAAFGARLRAIADANNLLLDRDWQVALVPNLVETCIAPFRDGRTDQFRLDGPALPVSSGAALAFGMALHELCTNAAKYGALSVQTGRVDIRWAVSHSIDPPSFGLTWTETGGPPVSPPARTGFGSRVIRQVLEQQIGGAVDLTYAVTGVLCRITAPVAALTPASRPQA